MWVHGLVVHIIIQTFFHELSKLFMISNKVDYGSDMIFMLTYVQGNV